MVDVKEMTCHMTGKPPGILLVLENVTDERHLNALKSTAYWIRVWTITPADLQ